MFMLNSNRSGKYNMNPCYELISYWFSVIYHVCIFTDNKKLWKLQCNVITLKWLYEWYMSLLTYVNIFIFLVNVGKVTSQSQLSHVVHGRYLHDNMAPVNSNCHNFMCFWCSGFKFKIILFFSMMFRSTITP